MGMGKEDTVAAADLTQSKAQRSGGTVTSVGSNSAETPEGGTDILCCRDEDGPTSANRRGGPGRESFVFGGWSREPPAPRPCPLLPVWLCISHAAPGLAQPRIPHNEPRVLWPPHTANSLIYLPHDPDKRIPHGDSSLLPMTRRVAGLLSASGCPNSFGIFFLGAAAVVKLI